MKEVAEKLKLKSLDAAARWCSKQKIDTFFLGNKRVVPEFAFTLAYEKPFIEQLKQKHGADWYAYYEAFQNQDIKAYNELEMNNKPKVFTKSKFDADAFLTKIGYGKS